MAERMIGLDRLIKARSRGFKPAGWVSVDVGSIGYQSMLRQTVNADGVPRMLALWSVETDKPGALYVLAHPGESVRMADWAWCIGLRVQVDGDDPVRVAAAHERIVAAGAERVVSTCFDGSNSLLIDSAEAAKEPA